MNCLRLREIHLYLEKELETSLAPDLEKHLAACSRCREVYADRKAFLEAARNLDDVELPSGFAQRIMARIPPFRVSLIGWLTALIAGLLMFFSGGLIYGHLTGQSFPGLLISASKTIWSFIQDVSMMFFKIAKLAAVSLKFVLKFAAGLIEGLMRLNSLIRPEIYVFCALTILAFIALMIAAFKGKNNLGEES